jgi:fatty acid desaturase
MGLDIMRDRRVRGVVWRDLTHLKRREVVYELTLSLPWLGLSWWLAGRGCWAGALGASFMFFLTGLRQSHGAQHYTLGVSRRATEWALFVLSVLMLGSMHAIQATHLHHHKHCLDEQDVEASSARGGWLRALAMGPIFPVMLQCKALELGNARQRRWIVAELAANVVWVGLVFGLLPWTALRYHVLAMAAGQCFTAFFAVWTVHHDCDREHFIARTLRGRLRNWMSYAMFLHVEHHLFPAVPTSHLGELARRLDQAAPELKGKKIFSHG